MNNPKEEEEFLLKDQLALTQTDTFHIKFMKLCLLIALLMKHILVVLSGQVFGKVKVFSVQSSNVKPVLFPDLYVGQSFLCTD